MSPRTRSRRTRRSRGRCRRTAARARAETSTLPRRQRSRSILCPGTTCSSATSPRTTCWECTSPSPSSNAPALSTQPAGRELGGLSIRARPGDKTVVAPIRETADLVERRPRAVADVDLAKLRERLDGNSVPLRDHLRGVSGSREIARDDSVELHLGQLVGNDLRLLPTPRG